MKKLISIFILVFLIYSQNEFTQVEILKAEKIQAAPFGVAVYSSREKKDREWKYYIPWFRIIKIVDTEEKDSNEKN